MKSKGAASLFMALALVMFIVSSAKAQGSPTGCVSYHQVPYKFFSTNSYRDAGIDWHAKLDQTYTEDWTFKVEHPIVSHKIQFEFMELVKDWQAPQNSDETCQIPSCAPRLAIGIKYPDGTMGYMTAVRQPGLESLKTGTVLLNGRPPALVYFLDEDRTTVTVLVPDHPKYGPTIPAGSYINVKVGVPPLLNSRCQEGCRGLYVLGSKQRSCQMSYLSCEPTGN